MQKTTLAVIAVVAVLACAGGVLYYLHSEHPVYRISDMSEALGIVTFTASADLDDPSTITVWAGDVRMSMLGMDEWTVKAGHWEQTFVMTLPEGMTEEEFDDVLEIHFDGKEGWRR